jgi:predicted AAA+ superfamily ATPase
VSKETLLRYLEQFEDAFLLFSLTLAAESERGRQVNPRELYLADHGLANAFRASGRLTRFCP